MREVAEREGARARPIVVAAGARGALALALVALTAASVAWPGDEGDPLAGELGAFLLEEGAARPLEEGALLPPGARVQLTYRLVEDGLAEGPLELHGVIFSVDERGRRTLHFPHHEGASTLLERTQGVLPSSFELDDTPGSERFYLVLGRRPLPVRRLLGAEPSAKPAFSLVKRLP